MAKFKAAAKNKTGAAKPSASKSNEGPSNKAEGISRSIMDSAQQIWMAGLGAFGRAQEEGTKLFEALVSEGMKLEKSTRQLATGKVDAVRGVVENRVGAVKERAADTWDRLEKVFEERVQRALNRLGVPSREDLQGLNERVDQLNAELRRLSGTSKPAPKAKPAAKASSKPAKKASSKKTAAPSAAVAQAAPIQDAAE